jgi:hypothetical protein
MTTKRLLVTTLPQLVPTVDYLISLETEELAGYLLVPLAAQRQSAGVVLTNYLSTLFNPHPHPASYSDRSKQQEAELAITEAWNWLEVQGLLVPASGINGSHGWKRFSRRAERMSSADDVKQFARSRRIEKDRLHSKIAQPVWSAYMRGRI